MADIKKIIGIDIGGTKCAVIYANVTEDNIEIIEKKKLKTDNDKDPYKIIEEFCEIINKIAKPNGIDAIGNSCNVLNACYLAKGLGLTAIGLTGRDGGKLKSASDICVIAPEHEIFKIQELHLPIYHCICAMV